MLDKHKALPNPAFAQGRFHVRGDIDKLPLDDTQQHSLPIFSIKMVNEDYSFAFRNL